MGDSWVASDPEGIEGPPPSQPSETPSSTGAFDSHHPPAPELINQCVHCGFCLPACPTYALWGDEMDSPRGRIYLIKMAGEGADMNRSGSAISTRAWAAYRA